MSKKVCFVIMGFGKKQDYSTGESYDLDKTYKNIIKPAVVSCGYDCIRADELKESAIIDKSMYGLLYYADLVIADISTSNPNAIYELGIRHALKPYHTIILKEESGSLQFDLSHNRIVTYKHLGDDIGVDESKRCIDHLRNIIKSIEKTKVIDSPLYEFIRNIEPVKIPDEEIQNIIGQLAEKYDNLFALVEEANRLRANGDFLKASELWSRASEKVPNEPYYIQQQALCRYKSKHPTEEAALNEATFIINKLLIKDNYLTTDTETLGIAGAIYKNLYFINKNIFNLDKAIEYYKQGFNYRKDYYTGENYALCLNIKSSLLDDMDEKIYYKVEAKKVRIEIIKILKEIVLSTNYNDRDDKKWINATLANCYYSIADKANAIEYEEKFKELSEEPWELETYELNKKELLTLIGGN